MSKCIIGMDFNNKPYVTIAIYGMRCGKTYLMRWWLQLYRPDPLSQHLIRRLAAEAIINISIHS